MTTPIESTEEKCDCPTKYCKHFESDFDKYCKENPHCDECEKAMKCLEVSECKGMCEEEKGGWEESEEFANLLFNYGYERFDENGTGDGIAEKQYIVDFIHKLLRSELATAREEERKRIDEEITKQFKYASEHDNYDMRGVDWSAIIRPRN